MIPRPLHPGAWWLWALALAAAAIRTSNPLLLLLIAAVAWVVVVSRRVEAPWARSFGSFVKLGLWVIAIRLVLQALFAPRIPGHTLFTFPHADLPSWLSGVSLGGPVTREALVGALYSALQLAVLLACIGAANSLASPYRLLRSLPAVLYEAGVVVTVALAFAPMATTSAKRVQEARRLRGRPHRGLAGLRGMTVPVLEGALDRSLALAASMDTRGYGRRAAVAASRRRATQSALLAGLLGVVAGTYGVLDASAPTAALGIPLLFAGAGCLATSLFLAGAHSTRTRYRPDPWRLPEWLTVASGAATLAALVATKHDPALHPSTSPLSVPDLPWAAAVGILLAALPSVATPDPLPSPPALAPAPT